MKILPDRVRILTDQPASPEAGKGKDQAPHLRGTVPGQKPDASALRNLSAETVYDPPDCRRLFLSDPAHGRQGAVGSVQQVLQIKKARLFQCLYTDSRSGTPQFPDGDLPQGSPHILHAHRFRGLLKLILLPAGISGQGFQFFVQS